MHGRCAPEATRPPARSGPDLIFSWRSHVLAIAYVAMTSIDRRMLDRELKKGSAELIILSIVETRARHGYEISQQIEQRSAGQLKFHIASLYPLLYRLEERSEERRVGRQCR